ncbi:Cys-tRNA(Pro) deacylase [Micromonospora sp. NBC_01813]|uniref:Cys-tRNA(Pro) deacylase n=1 Tax=Micromonospora sp. NBC_01813 TaxID=2975988 RepID=UPI002DD980D8|nr:Cys-tRNA(Pro) deacylase [Micromonospora sp. NBC_01813]WSA08261.1 Cys-tRNA(Pro) deacylase [Micromonospora sp. NBC_01813]
MAGTATPATALLTKRRIPFRVHPYQVSPDTPDYGAAVALALGVAAEQVFKTLVAQVDGALAVGIVPVTGELDLKAFAAALGGKRAVLAERALAERTTGYVRGGISPLGQRKRLPTVLDTSAQRFAEVYVSAGRRGLQVSLAPADLLAAAAAHLAPIATP